MGMPYAARNLKHQAGRPAWINSTGRLGQDIGKTSAANPAHGAEHASIRLSEAEDRHDVGVVQLGTGPGLRNEAPAADRIAEGPCREDHLEGHLASQGHLTRPVHDTGPAAPKFLDQLVLAQPSEAGT